MAKYKVGDKVRIVSERPRYFWNPEMDKYLGKAMTIIESGINPNGVYYHMEDSKDFDFYWYWYEDMIAGLAEQEKPAEQKGDNNMKTETNQSLRSLVENHRIYLLNERDRIIDRITLDTMSGDEFGDLTFRLSEICREIRESGDALTALRTEESQKQPPALSEKTVEFIRQLLKISLDCTREMSDRVKKITPLLPFGEAQDNLILAAKVKEDTATTALNEFNAAYPYPKKPESK